MAQIVQTRAAPRRRCDAGPVDQSVEGLFDGIVAQRQSTRVSEYPISFGTGPAARQIALQARDCVSCSGARRVFRNLVSRISRPSRVMSATVSFSASEIRNPVTESSAINVA